MGKSITTKPSTPTTIQISTPGQDTCHAGALALDSNVDTNVDLPLKSLETYTSLIACNGTCMSFCHIHLCLLNQGKFEIPMAFNRAVRRPSSLEVLVESKGNYAVVGQ